MVNSATVYHPEVKSGISCLLDYPNLEDEVHVPSPSSDLDLVYRRTSSRVTLEPSPTTPDAPGVLQRVLLCNFERPCKNGDDTNLV